MAEEVYAAAGAVKERVLGIGVLYLLINSVFLEEGGMGEGEPWSLLAMFGHTCYPLLTVNLLIGAHMRARAGAE